MDHDQEKLKTIDDKIKVDDARTTLDKQKKTELLSKGREDRMKRFRKKIQEVFTGKNIELSDLDR